MLRLSLVAGAVTAAVMSLVAADAPKAAGDTTPGERTGGADERTVVGAGARGFPEGFSPSPGERVFRVVVPRIGVDEPVVAGVAQPQLENTLGHYPSCRDAFPYPVCSPFPERWPGESGPTFVAGHRTIAEHQFARLGRIRPGDRIYALSKFGGFVYEVTGRRIVDAADQSVITPSTEPQMILISCHPRFSAAQRLIVYSRLITEGPRPAIERAADLWLHNGPEPPWPELPVPENEATL